MIERLLAPYEEQLQQAESMPGWGRRAAQDALAETGTDMSRFQTGAHLASWAGRTPLDNSSGKRKGKAKSKKGNRYLGGLLVEAGERGLAGVLGLEFDPAPYVLSSVLTYCDMTTSPDSELVPVERRLAEIHHRYGPGHLVSRSIQHTTPMILRAVEQVHGRAA